MKEVVKFIGLLTLAVCALLITVLYPVGAVIFIAGVFAGLYYADYDRRRSQR